MVNSVNGSGSQDLAELKARMDELKAKRDDAKGTKETKDGAKTEAESTKGSAETEKSSADSIKTQAETQKALAKEAVDIAEQTYGNASANLETANQYVDGAYRAYQNALNADPPNESAVASAKATYEYAQEQQKAASEAVKEAEEGREAANAALKEAEEALEKAEADAEDAAAALEEAIAALDNAVVELDEAVDALETAEEEFKVAEEEHAAAARRAPGADGVGGSEPIMSEEEAISQGYTVIKSYEDLLAIGNNLGGKYILMGDIDIPDGVNWTPIGDADSPFTGEFNGNGCNIRNLNIAVTEDDAKNIGFFGVTDGATIKDVTFVDAKVNGKDDYLTGTTGVGILAGCIRGTTVTGVNVTGDSSVTGYANVGGLIGTVDDSGLGGVSKGNSYIENCHTNVDVHSKYAAGGLIGSVASCADRFEDHRGIVNRSLIIRDCSTSGSATVDDESVGGLIGESGKTLITLDRCSSDMSLTWTNDDGLGDLSFLLETGRIGGLVGNVNGSYITFANCEFNGALNGDTEFQSEVYGWYMDDAHVCIYDLPAGLPVDDILNISGVDGMTLLDNGKYQCTVSTLAGLDKMIAMLKENPDLADMITWQINFDFDAMNGEYDYSEYAQYGVVQHLYEDEEGNVHNDTYIDNECDLESTYHAPEAGGGCGGGGGQCSGQCEPCEKLTPTMVPGLYKDEDGDYAVIDSNGQVRKVDLDINADGQITDVSKRLTSSEVAFRERLVELGKDIQQQMRDILKRMFNWNSDESVPILSKAEYKKLLKKAEKYGYDSLTDAEKLGMAVFEADYDIMNAQAKYTKNLGCGMGGNASFLDKTTTHQMFDENGNALYTNLNGDSLIATAFDENGKPTAYAYSGSGEPYYDMAEVFEQRGYQNTDADGNLLFDFKGEDGTTSTVTQVKDKDGNVSYVTTDADGNQVPFDGDVNSLQRQLTPANYADDYSNFESDLQQILQDVKDGKYPKGMSSGGDSGDVDGDGDVDDKDEEEV